MLTTAAPARRPGTAGPGRPAAASTLSPDWLSGPPGPARVVATFERAAYLLHDDEVLPLLAPGALPLPGGLRVGSPADLHALRLRTGDEVVVGHGRVASASGALVVRRTWRPTAVPPGGLSRSSAWRVAEAVRSLSGLTDDLPPALVRMSPSLPAPTVAASVVGLGPGLTPAGDDLLCGALLGLVGLGDHRRRAALARAVGPLLGRTTALSATLLRQAALGYAVPPVVDLFRAASRGADTGALRGAAVKVAAVGHTSGAALLLGAVAVLAPATGDVHGIPLVADHPHPPDDGASGARRGPS